MKLPKFGLLILSILIVSSLPAQSTSSIIGEWESTESDGHGKYSIFEHNGKLYALMYYWKDDKEEFSLEKELGDYTNADADSWDELSSSDIFDNLQELIILKDFSKNGNSWKGDLIYDDDGSTIDGSLSLLNNGQLELSYSYWGMTEKTSWTRIK
ncbi:MAG: hypothetical protein AAF391_08875 [Bacteroidota bacterium]